MTSPIPARLAWLGLVRAPLIISAGAVAVTLVVRETIRIATTQRMVWWLPTLAIGAALIGVALGLFWFHRGLSQLSQDGRAHRPLLTLTALLMAGFGVAFWFGWTVPKGDLQLSLLFVAVMAAAVAAGALVGFLFGLPRFTYAARQPVPPTNGTEAPSASNGSASVDYRPSTNLDDVADWLSKIIVGLGLTQLAMVGTHLESITTWVLGPYPAEVKQQQGFLAALIVVGIIGGFLFGYVWTRLNYAELAAGADVRATKVLREQESRSVADVGIGKPVPSAPSGARVGPGEAGEVRHSYEEDPQKNRFGGLPERNERRLSAKVEPSELGKGLYRLTFTVASTNPRRPLAGPVEFHLHPTFRNPVQTRTAVNGTATLTVVSYGAFTCGVVADDGQTRLELDLAELEVPLDFKSR